MELEGIKNGSLFYIGRDNGHMVEYIIQAGDARYIEAQRDILARAEKLQKLKEQIEKNETPDREFDIVLKKTDDGLSWEFTKYKVKYKTDWRCSYCTWRDSCWKKEIEDFKADDTAKFFINGGKI